MFLGGAAAQKHTPRAPADNICVHTHLVYILVTEYTLLRRTQCGWRTRRFPETQTKIVVFTELAVVFVC